SLIGTFVAFGGVIMGFEVATRNVLRQMRVNLISREEDRIEAMLPGLHDAQIFLSDLGHELALAGQPHARNVLSERGFGSNADDVEKSVEDRLPRCDPATQQLVSHTIIDLAQALRQRDDYARQAVESRKYLSMNPLRPGYSDELDVGIRGHHEMILKLEDLN